MTVMNRGTSNSAVRGSAEARRRRKQHLLETYRADVDVEPLPTGWTRTDAFGSRRTAWERGTGLLPVPVALGEGEPACRCYRCGQLLTVETLEVDRIVPGCRKTAEYPNGGTYVRKNIRPACGPCNRITGNQLRWEGRS
jgi:5-methylcytosine-specific restriction endonuclease McrA